MPTRKGATERKKTDDSLAGERAKADGVVLAKAHVEEVEDAVIVKARDTADAVVRRTRARSDNGTLDPCADVSAERRVADQEVANERAAADSALRAERAAGTRLLARLLPLEREQTDQFLLTERARSDDAVANREDILSMVSHDLRGLLGTVVLGASSIVETGDADQRGTAERIQRAAGRMARLIDDLVDIASIDAGKLSVTPVSTSVRAMIDDAVDTWCPPALARGIRLEARGTTAREGRFDPERILQVLGNVITNAAKFSPRDTAIGISAEVVDEMIRFSVSDAGQGIAEDKLDAVFERFWQAGKSDRRGLGLGLYISRCIIEAHGGKMWVTSKEGVGSTFYFTVPLK